MIAFIDRNFNLLFFKRKCLKIILSNNLFKYNDIVENIPFKYRYLGKNWYKEITGLSKKTIKIKPYKISDELVEDIKNNWHEYNGEIFKMKLK